MNDPVQLTVNDLFAKIGRMAIDHDLALQTIEQKEARIKELERQLSRKGESLIKE